MFGEDQQFYPTPEALIKKMLKPWEYTFRESFRGSLEQGWDTTVYKLGGRRILEPSAGKGDILDFISKINGNRGRNLKSYCIEIDPDLREVLKGKGYRVVGEDFLEYDEDYFFDMVLMNPPFNRGVDHVLKAWDTLKLGGDIVAIINADTIRKPHTKKREQLLRLIEDHGRYEIVKDGFKDAERTTDVDIAIVWLEKPKQPNPFDFTFESEQELEGDLKITKESASNAVALNDQTGAMIEAYHNTKAAVIEYMRAQAKLQMYAKPLLSSNTSVIDMVNSAISSNGHSAEAFNEFMDSFKMGAWREIMNTLGIDRLMTSNVSKNFDKFVEGQGSMAFTRENIYNLVMMLVQNSGAILDQAVVDVFDLFTKFHSENRCHVEGWKTNEAWKVNKKVILPNFIRMGYGKNFETSYSKWSEFKDIDKAMCYLDGKKFEEIKTLEDSIKEYPIGHTGKMESEFFEFRCYKKGTIHLFFKEESLWARFNQKACEGKNWLG